jgi:ribosomal protein L31
MAREPRRRETLDEIMDRREDTVVRHPIRSLVIVIAVLSLVIGGFSWVYWGTSVFTAKAVGQGEAYKKKVSSDNWTQQQGQFQTIFEDVAEADAALTRDQINLDAFNKQHPNYAGNGQVVDPLQDRLNTLQDAVTSDKDSCVRNQKDYVAKGNTYLAEDFRDHGLPKTFVADDPAWNTPPRNAQFIDYDCKAGTSDTPYPAAA